MPIASGLTYIPVHTQTPVHYTVALPEAVPAARHRFNTPSGVKLSYYADDQTPGQPLVLIHSINAAASVFEMKPLFEHYQSQRPVYAPDLPGFGFSERSPRPYSPKLYANTINTFLEEIVGEAADVVALSLSSEFAARAAVERPELFRSLTVISPTGMRANTPTVPSEALYNFFTFPLWSKSLFDLLTIRASIRYFLNKNFATEAPDEMIEYAYAAAQQKGARHAPYYFVFGQLFTDDATEAFYKNLTIPGLVLYDRDPNTSFDKLPELLKENAHWQAQRISPTCGLPHWEKPDETFAALDAFWAGINTANA